MGDNTKDNIKFHTFLSTQRKLQNATLEQLGRGIYSYSNMQRIERGERLPEKMQRDRIVARLGISGEEYEDYLPLKDYNEWLMRQQIISYIEKSELSKAIHLIEKYATKKNASKIEKQFIATMKYMCRKQEGASRNELLMIIEEAVKYTIPMNRQKVSEFVVLADQEVNLLIEYYSLAYPLKEGSDEHKWRIKAYESILEIIDNSYIDKIGKCKIYTKLVVFLGKETLTVEVSLLRLKKILELCNVAIELLRDKKLMYYLVELLELRVIVIDKMQKFKCRENVQWMKIKEESVCWKKVLLALFQQYTISAYMDNFCYLYQEAESYAVGNVIQVRRKMLNLTRLQLSDGICSDRTIERIELGKQKPQMYVLARVFERIGLSPEYMRTRVITSDAKVLKLHRKLTFYANYYRLKEYEECLEELEKKLCIDIPQNLQIIMRHRAFLQMQTKERSREETVLMLKNTLEKTIKLDSILHAEEIYLNIEEISCLYSIAIRILPQEDNPYIKILYDYCKKIVEGNAISHRKAVDEMLFTGLANYLGNIGKNEEANELARYMIAESLKNRRTHTLANNLYQISLNSHKEDRLSAREVLQYRDILEECIVLSDMNKATNLKEIFKRKYDEIS